MWKCLVGRFQHSVMMLPSFLTMARFDWADTVRPVQKGRKGVGRSGVEFSGQAGFALILYRDATTITTCCWRLCLPRYQSRGWMGYALSQGLGDYLAFRKILIEAHDWLDVPLLAYCVMPNHWHLVLWPAHDGDLSEFMRWLTVTHTQRDHAHYHTPGTGPLYQGRLKAFPIAEDEHLLTVLRYVERNPLRAGMVCSRSPLVLEQFGAGVSAFARGLSLQEGPVAKPAEWWSWVDGVETEAELRALRRSVIRGEHPMGPRCGRRKHRSGWVCKRLYDRWVVRQSRSNRGKTCESTPDPLSPPGPSLQARKGRGIRFILNILAEPCAQLVRGRTSRPLRAPAFCAAPAS